MSSSNSLVPPRDTVIGEHGSLDIYLNKMLESKASFPAFSLMSPAHIWIGQAKCVEFYKFLEEKYPPLDGVSSTQNFQQLSH